MWRDSIPKHTGVCNAILMHCHQALKNNPGQPFNLLFLELPLRPRVQYVVEVVRKIFVHHNFLIRDQIDLLSKGAVAKKVSVKGVSLGVERLAITSFFKNYVLLIVAAAH